VLLLLIYRFAGVPLARVGLVVSLFAALAAALATGELSVTPSCSSTP
jgi:hypothetical protein